MDRKRFELYIQTEVIRLESKLKMYENDILSHPKHEANLKGQIEALNKIHLYMTSEPKNYRDATNRNL